MTPAKLLVLDPPTLMGKELLRCIAESPELSPDIEFRHTGADDEHQITEIGGRPALVPPLDSAADLVGFDAVIVTSDAQGSRHDHLIEFAGSDPDAALLDLSRLACLHEHTVASAGEISGGSRHLRVAHPALVASARILEVLTHLGRPRGTLAVFDPVSVYGREAIELLALQGAHRLQGASPAELIYGNVRAFNTLAVDPSLLQDEASQVLPGLPLAISHCLSGMFHGHLAHLGLCFDESLAPELVQEVLLQAEGLEQVQFPLGLDTVVDHDRVLVTPFSLSPDGRQIAVTMMIDGLRVGGALTGLEILQDLL